MTREIKLHSIDIWNRATIADGNKLQSTTIKPLSANDTILAKAVASYSSELQKYYDTDYKKVVTDISPDIIKWNDTKQLVTNNSSNWISVYNGTNISSNNWCNVYSTLTRSANLWNIIGYSAQSGAAASAWLSKNNLPNNDPIDDFDCVRPTGETGLQYELAKGSIGKDSLFITIWSAWSGADNGQRIYQLPMRYAGGDRNITIMPWHVSPSASGTNNISIVDYNKTFYSNNTLLFGSYGILTHNCNPQPYYEGDYKHRTTDNSILFIKGGSDDFNNSLVNSRISSLDLKNTFARGGMNQKQENSITFSYFTDNCESISIPNGSEIYGVYNSITNMKGRNTNTFIGAGIYNTLNIKGTQFGLKGGDIEIRQFPHNMWDIALHNSVANNACSLNRLPYSAVYNSMVQSYYRSDSTPFKAYSGHAENSNVLVTNVDAQRYSEYKNSLINLNKSSDREKRIGDSYYMLSNNGGTVNSYGSLIRCNDISTPNLYINDSLVNCNNMNCGSDCSFYNSLILNMSACGIYKNWNNVLVVNAHNFNQIYTGITPEDVNNTILFNINASDIQGYQTHSLTKNSILDLELGAGVHKNNFANSYVREHLTQVESSTPVFITSRINRKNSFVIEDDVKNEECIPGQQWGDIYTSPTFAITSKVRILGTINGYSNSKPIFILSSNSQLKNIQNTFIVGDNNKQSVTYNKVNSPDLIFGHHISLSTLNASYDYMLFGHNQNVYFNKTNAETLVLGARYDGRTSSRMTKLLDTILNDDTSQKDDSEKIILCDDTGPFFVVTKIGYDISKNHNGMYFYRSNKWHDIKTGISLG